MKATDFTLHPKVQSLLADLRTGGYDDINNHPVSDVIDGKYQYVDLVMEGGGVLGVALAGYVYVMEQMNIRFLQLGGTSAGAINTMLMAAAGKIHEPKTDWILEQISNKNFYDFVDGGKDVRSFIDAALNHESDVKLIFEGARVIDNIKDHQGLNPGTNFHDWIKGLLSQKGVNTTDDLKALRKLGPDGGLFSRLDSSIRYGSDEYERVVIISSDITTESKIIFPEMGSLYWADPGQTSPADYVRASMSIPFFFWPFTVSNAPVDAGSRQRWIDNTGYIGDPPAVVKFVDGGIMSNFPIDVFHEHEKIPSSPTFGVKLGADRNKANNTDKIFGFIGAIFDSARHVHDYDFLFRNPDYQKLIAIIDTGDQNWLDFGIADDAKIKLFVSGAQAASDFLKGFDWPGYKQLRGHLAQLYS